MLNAVLGTLIIKYSLAILADLGWMGKEAFRDLKYTSTYNKILP